MWYIIKALRQSNLRGYILRKLYYYKSYKECFDAIEEAWEQTYYMNDDYTEKMQSASEVNWDPQMGWNGTGMMCKSINSKQKLTRSTKSMVDTPQTTISDCKDPQDRDSKGTNTSRTEMADSQATTLVAPDSSHPDTKAQW